METFDAPYHIATYKGETNEAYHQEGQYEIHVQKMSDGRFQVCKSLAHWKEHSGHKGYPTLDAVKQDFSW